MRYLIQIPVWFSFSLKALVASLAGLGVGEALTQTVTPVLLASAQAPVPPPLGMLILSPAQRRNLEALRRMTSDDEGGLPVQNEEFLDAAPTLPDALVVSGVVIRSGNRSTVWVNNQPLYGRAAATPLSTLAGQAGVMQPGLKDMQRVRPGHVIDVPSGKAVDLLPPGAIRIIPPKAGGGTAKKE